MRLISLAMIYVDLIFGEVLSLSMVCPGSIQPHNINKWKKSLLKEMVF